MVTKERQVASDLLGVPPFSPERVVRRAYRKRVVLCHRTQLLALAEHLESLKWAYDTMREPALAIIRRSVAPPEHLKRRVLQGAVLAELAREREAMVNRVSEAAVAQNAPLMKELEGEYERRRAEEVAALARKKLVARVIPLGIVLALLAALLVYLLR